MILWKQSTSKDVGRSTLFGAAETDDEEDGKENERGTPAEHWTPAQHFRASDLEDIYDLAWSPDSRYVLFGLTDHSIQIWDTTSGIFYIYGAMKM